jgi:hypothetical protein
MSTHAVDSRVQKQLNGPSEISSPPQTLDEKNFSKSISIFQEEMHYLQQPFVNMF